MAKSNFKRTKFACYVAYFTMSSVFSLPPLLFVTFHKMYNISWTLLGTLVVVNFCTQFAIDLMFTLFSSKFNVSKVVKIMPLITSLGLAIYALFPMAVPNYAYVGLLIGTVIFSISAGLSEVLLSPIIAAIPSENSQKDMSTLHSLYAFGVLSVVVVGTLFIKIFGAENWAYITLFFAELPIIAAVLFMKSPMPALNGDSSSRKKEASGKKILGIALCLACIFFGSCAENAMSNWISGYMEVQLHIDKAVGDIVGMALFAVLLGVTRICYAKFGKNISRILLIGMIGASVCYLVAGLSPYTIPAFIACILTGAFTAMLCPGTLILMEEKISGVGVTAYAIMAAGGDLGASVAPQLLGVIADHVSLKTGMLVCSVFPIFGIAVMVMIRHFLNVKKDA